MIIKQQFLKIQQINHLLSKLKILHTKTFPIYNTYMTLLIHLLNKNIRVRKINSNDLNVYKVKPIITILLLNIELCSSTTHLKHIINIKTFLTEYEICT